MTRTVVQRNDEVVEAESTENDDTKSRDVSLDENGKKVKKREFCRKRGVEDDVWR
jgi:hypothetical protein